MRFSIDDAGLSLSVREYDGERRFAESHLFAYYRALAQGTYAIVFSKLQQGTAYTLSIAAIADVDHVEEMSLFTVHFR